ncbi:MAG: response regulator [Planctomycetia bacterium]
MARNSSGSLLVVDDDRHIQMAMADYLRSLGHRTETASTCEEALSRMEEFPFEVVICDVNLPDKDGFHLLQWARDNSPETAVILLTGFGTIESAVEAIRMGAFDYLTKPVIDEELRFAERHDQAELTARHHRVEIAERHRRDRQRHRGRGLRARTVAKSRP